MLIQINENILAKLKLHILEAIYSRVLNNTFNSGCEFIAKIILASDQTLVKYLPNLKLLSKLFISSINTYFLLNYSADFGELCLNFIRLNDSSIKPFQSLDLKQKLIYLFFNNYLEAIFEFILAKISIEKLEKMFNTSKNLIEVLYSTLYLFNKHFVYTGIINHFFGIFSANRGTTDPANASSGFSFGSRSFNLFCLYMFVKIGEWFYSKNSEVKTNFYIEPPIENSLLKANIANDKITKNYILNKEGENKIANNNICYICSDSILELVVCRYCSKKFCENCVVKDILFIIDELNEELTSCCKNNLIVNTEAISSFLSKSKESGTPNTVIFKELKKIWVGNQKAYIKIYDK